VNGDLCFGWLHFVCGCVQTADSLLILHQEMWVKFLSPGLSMMSYSTSKPDSAVVLGNLLRK